jgi:hypothetical protein
LKLAAAALLTSLLWATVSVADSTAEPAQQHAQEFSLKIGESALARHDPGLRIGFENVTTDSRCPKGLQCVWAGDVSLTVWLQRGLEPRQTFELNGPAGKVQVLYAFNHRLHLLRLEPYPLAGRPIAAEDYVATLSLRSGVAEANE